MRCAALVLGVELAAWAPLALAQPAIEHPIEDHAELLTDEEERELQTMLLAHQTATGVQMAVLLVRSTDGVPIDDYALRAAERWGGGRAGVDDGVLFVVATEQHDMKLEVGYGLEEAIPDSVALRILASIRDDFRAERWADGVRRVIAQVIERTGPGSPRAASASSPAPVRAEPRPTGIGAGTWILAGLLVLAGIGGAFYVLRRKSS